MKKILLIALLCLPMLSQGQDTSFARRIIRDLSSPAMYGRSCGHSGDSIAAEYLRNEMRSLGLRPLVENYFQPVYYDVYDIDSCDLTIGKRQYKPYEEFRIYSAKRYATEKHLKKAKKKKLVDGVWYIGVDKLHTYSPVAGPYERNPYCVEILNSCFPRSFKKLSANIDLIHNTDYKSQNIMGFFRGEVDTMIVFTAHYDHCGTMGEHVYFPGAHDNASGVAAVLDLARIASASKPHYTLVYMLFCGEESGLKGSKTAVENSPIDLSKVKALVNIDMFCGGEKGLMVFNANADDTKPYIDRMETINEKWELVPAIKRRDNSPNSDHYPFSSHCPAMFFITMGGPNGNYHDPADTCKFCGLQYYVNNMRLILGMLGMDFEQ